MTSEQLLALASRVEAATADRELDAEVALARGIVRERDGDSFFGHRDHSVMVLERDYYDHGGNAPELPHYTASLDAAMTLVDDYEIASTLDEAMERVSRNGWQEGDYRGALIRAFVAAALRAAANMEGE
ncbi:hypothetical protein LZK98_11665 [Sphingomonas cannabina]|uniref:hypothetical protein n=1 Tax=Sphingomonas cannabina TaxID=2899123 RepID=UPI001F3EE770|nr:hypothetical protein [Sphingomonas cannabina]UIJ43748.1 hypothetical protein LZK98_11665 [Sphingomonas cannabina]